MRQYALRRLDIRTLHYTTQVSSRSLDLLECHRVGWRYDALRRRPRSHLSSARSLRLYSQQSQPRGRTEADRQPSQRDDPQKEEGYPDELTLPIALPGSPGGTGGSGGGGLFRMTGSPFVDAAITTIIGLGMVFFGGVGYVAWYKRNVLNKIEQAFEPGYDPALELVARSKTRTSIPEEINETDLSTLHVRRKEQDDVDNIVQGKATGHYYMLLGSKGTGKTTMMFDAMQHINADGIAVCEAHPDLEVFRLRLGKALNYEYHEDSQTGLFQRRDPREGGPALDIERALNKLEKVALRAAQKKKRPLVLIFNNVHFFQHNDEGMNLLLQLQQRAEAWAESGIMTMVFSTDDVWPFFVLRKNASRMQVLSIYDLSLSEALRASKRIRFSSGLHHSTEDENLMKDALGHVGGRLSYINKIMREPGIVPAALDLVAKEKGWLMSRIGLIADCDDDVMDEQKWSSCSWLLLREFVKMHRERERIRVEAITSGRIVDEESSDVITMPSIPYWKCRQIMTRADFLDDLDRANIVSIDINHEVRPDSMLILQAACEVVEEDGFDDLLDNVRDRIDEIESLHRTRELTFKDLQSGDRISLTVDKGGAMLLGSKL